MDDGTKIGLAVIFALAVGALAFFYSITEYNKGQKALANDCIQAGGSWVQSNCIAPRGSIAQ